MNETDFLFWRAMSGPPPSSIANGVLKGSRVITDEEPEHESIDPSTLAVVRERSRFELERDGVRLGIHEEKEHRGSGAPIRGIHKI